MLGKKLFPRSWWLTRAIWPWRPEQRLETLLVLGFVAGRDP
jgi:hypothetical protein